MSMSQTEIALKREIEAGFRVIEQYGYTVILRENPALRRVAFFIDALGDMDPAGVSVFAGVLVIEHEQASGVQNAGVADRVIFTIRALPRGLDQHRAFEARDPAMRLERFSAEPAI